MRTKIAVSLGLITMMAVALSSCSRTDARSPTGASGGLANPMSPFATAADTNHGGGPPPDRGPKPPVPAVVFVSADSVVPGDTTTTRWQLHNTAHQAFTMPWVLTSARNWPGFPKSGTAVLTAVGDQLVQVAFTAPDTAAAGPNGLVMTVTQKDGTTATANGAVQVLPIGP